MCDTSASSPHKRSVHRRIAGSLDCMRSYRVCVRTKEPASLSAESDNNFKDSLLPLERDGLYLIEKSRLTKNAVAMA